MRLLNFEELMLRFSWNFFFFSAPAIKISSRILALENSFSLHVLLVVSDTSARLLADSL